MLQALWISSSRQEVTIIDNIHLMGILHAITRTVRFEGKKEGSESPTTQALPQVKGPTSLHKILWVSTKVFQTLLCREK